MYVCIHIYMYICIYVYMYICICREKVLCIADCTIRLHNTHICIYVYIYVCIHVYAERRCFVFQIRSVALSAAAWYSPLLCAVQGFAVWHCVLLRGTERCVAQ